MNRNKALTIIIIAVVVIVAGLAVFYFFFRGGSVTPGQTPGGGGFPVGPGQGASTSTTSGQPTQTQPQYQNQPQTFAQKLRELSSLPTAGATIFQKNADTFVRYVERATGHIYEAQTSQNTPPHRISNTTIPKIYEAYWVQNGRGVALRYLKEGSDDIQTFYAALQPSATSTEQQLKNGVFLPTNLSGFTVSPNQEQVFYLNEAGNTAYGVKANPDGTQRSQLFSSALHEWLVSWPQARTVALTTKPSAGVGGYLYFLDTNSGALRKVIGGINGLTALVNSDASLVLFSQTAQSGLSLKLLDTKKQTVTDVGVSTLPEKCAWSKISKTILYCAVPDGIPAGQYPDSWYQGGVSFTDNIWKIDIQTGQTTVLLSPQSVAKQTMDIVNMTLDDREHYLLFSNKKDLSLWLLDISQGTTP